MALPAFIRRSGSDDDARYNGASPQIERFEEELRAGGGPAESKRTLWLNANVGAVESVGSERVKCQAPVATTARVVVTWSESLAHADQFSTVCSDLS